MSKLYAVINPAFTYEGSLVDMTAPLVNLYHFLRHERIAGYSLGSYVTFFSTLEAAKNYVAPEKGTLNKDVLRTRSQSAVIEFDATENAIADFGNIYTVSKIESSYGDTEYGRFEQVWKPVWESRVLTLDDVSEHAAAELLKKWQFERHMRTHSLEFLQETMFTPSEAMQFHNDELKLFLSGVVGSAGLAFGDAYPLIGLPIALAGWGGFAYYAYDSVAMLNSVKKRRTDYINNNIFAPDQRSKADTQVEVEQQVSCAKLDV